MNVLHLYLINNLKGGHKQEKDTRFFGLCVCVCLSLFAHTHYISVPVVLKGVRCVRLRAKAVGQSVKHGWVGDFKGGPKSP